MGLDRGGLDVFLCFLQNFYRGEGHQFIPEGSPPHLSCLSQQACLLIVKMLPDQ